MVTSTAFSVEYKIAPAQSYSVMTGLVISLHLEASSTLRLIFPWSQALATAYTYALLALSFVYMSAILAGESQHLVSMFPV